MKNLLDIIKDAQKIKQLAEKFGFTNIRIYIDKDSDDVDPLYLLVSSINPDRDGFDATFEACLIQDLGCQVVVYVESKIKELYIDSTLKNSANIDDQESLIRLCKKSLDQVQLQDVRNDQAFLNYQKRALRLAKRILDEKTNTENTNFFSTKKSKDQHPVESNVPPSIPALMHRTPPTSLKNQA